MVRLLHLCLHLALLAWIGGGAWVALALAPYLFGLARRGSEWVPHTTAAADLVGPMLQRADFVAWVAIPLALLALWQLRRRGWVPLGGPLASLLLVLAGAASVYEGAVLSPRVAAEQEAIKSEEGGLHRLDRDDPRRREFLALHGRATAIFFGSLAAGLVVVALVAPLRQRRGRP